MRIGAFLLAAVLLPAPAAVAGANDLELVDTVTKDGYIVGYFVNRSSVARDRDHAKAWIVSINSDEGGMINVDGVGYSRALYVYNCRARTAAIKALATYTASHRVARKPVELETRDLTFGSVIPGSIGEALLDTVCRAKGSI